MINVPYTLVLPGAVEPSVGSAGAAGLDLVAAEYTYEAEYVHAYNTGVAVEIPSGYVGLVFARSSVTKTGALLGNGVGVIDSDYRGPILVKFYHSEEEPPYKVGDRVAQLVVVPIPVVRLTYVSELAPTQRGAGGFGSTGV